jgi:uncharacterized caspase-like protein
MFSAGRGSSAQEGRGAGARPSEADVRVALVIGNLDYGAEVGRLRNPANDATDVAAALRRLGFTLIGGKAHLNLGKRQMLELIREFGGRIRGGGVGLFYFAGHGVQVEKKNYLIPITGALRFQEDAESEAVDVDQVLREMEYAENSLNILILDACRNNNLPRKTRAAGAGLGEPQRKPSGVYIAFAARDGQTASENPDGRNGLYTQELLKNLETPNLRLEDVFINTRREVKRLTNKRQEPIEYGSLDEVYYLKAEAPAVNKSRPTPTSAGVSPWERLRGTAKSLLKYEYVGEFSQDLALGVINDKWGFVDRAGEVVVTPKYDHACSFSEGRACVRLNDKVGFIDEAGSVVIPIKYDAATPFREGLASAGLNGKVGFIDKNGRTVIPFKYDNAGGFSDGLAMVRLNDKSGFINKSGNVVIPLEYDYAGNFSEGLADVGKPYADDPEGGEPLYKYGYIDKTGKLVVEMKYHNAGSFSEGLAVVVREGKQGYINKAGREVIPLEYDEEDCECSEFSDGLGRVTLNGKYGFVNLRGSEVISLKYDNVWCDAFRKEGFIGVEFNGKKGFVDLYGNEYFDF